MDEFRFLNHFGQAFFLVIEKFIQDVPESVEFQCAEMGHVFGLESDVGDGGDVADGVIGVYNLAIFSGKRKALLRRA